MLRRPNIQGQITIPKEFLKKLGFTEKDYFDVELKSDSIILRQVTVEPKFSGEEVERIEGLFNTPSNKGDIFDSPEKALRHLKSKVKK